MRPSFAALVALLLLATTGSTGRAAFIVTLTDQAALQPDGRYLYSYALAVDPASDLSATDFALDVAAGSNLSDITIPTGWSVAYTAGAPVVYWYAPLDGSFDVAPGASASFSFTSAFAPGAQAYTSFGFNRDTFDFDFAGGTALAPTAAPSARPAPEPASVATLASGLPVLAGLLWRRRSRAAGMRAAQ